MFPSAFVWNINPFSGEILVFQVKLAAILKMADPPIVTHTFSPNKPDFLFIDIHWPPKPLVLEKNSHFGNPNISVFISKTWEVEIYNNIIMSSLDVMLVLC